MNKVVGFLKFIFYISLLLLTVITLYPGSLLGLLLYGDSGTQPNLAENPYLDRLDHYLQLSNWLHVPKNFGSRAIIWRRSKNRRFGLSLENA